MAKIKTLPESKNTDVELVDWQQFLPWPVIGVDEVGRGCLAGPVYAVAVCLKSDEFSELFTDSKLISEKRREDLAPKILKAHWGGHRFCICRVINDQLNILQALLLAMKRAVEQLEIQMGTQAGHVWSDGHIKIPHLRCQQTTLIKGDLRCRPISAASIVAKVSRDRLMREFGLQYPGYGFEQHKGYGSSLHRAAIASKGPLAIHRKSFSGVKEFFGTGLAAGAGSAL